MKKIFVSMLITLSVFFMGNTVDAAPFIDLGDYDGARCQVDKGTYIVGGKMNQPKLMVDVYVSYNDVLKIGKFTFCQIDGEWQYQCEKSRFRTKGWEKVAYCKLANDVLYVITH